MVSVFLLFEHANLHKISLNNKANYPTNFRIPSIYLMKWPYGRDISMYVNNWWMPEHLRPLKCGLALILLISKVGINFLTLNLKFTFEEETHSFSKYPINQCVFWAELSCLWHIWYGDLFVPFSKMTIKIQ